MKQKLLSLFFALFLAFGLSAQTHFPIYNPSYYTNTPGDSDKYEKVVGRWNQALNQLKQQVNASNQNFAIFASLYKTSIDSMHYAFMKQVKAGKVSLSNVSHYMNSKKQVLQTMYSSFVNLSNSNPNILLTPKLLPLYIPPSCDSACTNMDFSSGDLTGWYGYYEVDNSSFSYVYSGITGGYLGAVQKAALDANTNTYQIHLTSLANDDWFLKNYHNINMPQASPWGTGHSVMIGDSTDNGAQVAILSQKFMVTPTNNNITYEYSVFLDNPPGHNYWEQPAFSVTLFDQNGDTIKNCGEYHVSSGPGLPGFRGEWDPIYGDTVYWRPWTQVDVPLLGYVGQCVTIQFQVNDCSLSGHFGYAYVNASCKQLQITASSPNGAICGKHGTITLFGPGGDAAYQWTGPVNSIIGKDTSQVAVVDSLGRYMLVITPAAGDLCKDTLYYTVKSRDTLSAIAAVLTPISCYGGSGDALATITSGLSPYTYVWSPFGGTNDVGTGLTAGAYTVAITDSNTCTTTATVSITQPTQVVATPTFTTATCGNSNGIASVTASGGVPGYKYLWTPGNNTDITISNLGAGSYTITVTDKNGCTGTSSITIPQSFVTVSMTNIADVSCFGGNTGSITAGVVGGVSPYTYVWTPGPGSTVTATGLSVGTYTVKVTDASGCTGTATTTLTQPTALTANITPNNILCNGGTGSATVSAGGGTPNYTYKWMPSAQTNTMAVGLSVGTYTVTVKDANGCTETSSISMTQPAVISATMTSVMHSSCNLPNGSATVGVVGGSGPYAYLWSPSGQTSAAAIGLSIGTYTVDVTDKNNCTTSATATITQPTLVVATVSGITNVTCNNAGTGSAIVTAVGGTGPYLYLWKPSGNTNSHATGLFALTYTVTVTDANGCTSSATATLSQPAPLDVTIIEPKIICKDSTGVIQASTSGGSLPYKYVWSAGVTSTTSTATITPIATRNYSVTITDANGCTATTEIILPYGPSLSVQVTGKASVCPGDSTLLCAIASGGEYGNSYLWEPGGNTRSCVVLAPISSTSTYTVAVIDGCGATTTVATTIRTNPSPTVSLSSNFLQGCAPLCIQFYDATTLSQGKIGQYRWRFGNGDTLHAQNPIYCYPSGGVYSVALTVTSDSGCSATLNKINMITVFSHPAAAFTISPQPVTIATPLVQFTDISKDPAGIVYRMWNFGDGGADSNSSTLENPTHTYHDTGTFCANLMVMDGHGCTDTTTDCLVIEPQYNLYIPSGFTPNGDGLNDVFQPVGKYIQSFEMYIFDRWGLLLYHTKDINKGWNGTMSGGSTVSQEDTYIYKIIVTDSQDNQHSYIGDINLLK